MVPEQQTDFSAAFGYKAMEAMRRKTELQTIQRMTTTDTAELQDSGRADAALLKRGKHLRR